MSKTDIRPTGAEDFYACKYTAGRATGEDPYSIFLN